jgi:phospholipase A1
MRFLPCRFALALCAALPFLASTAAAVEPPLPSTQSDSALAKCALIGAAADRLACYDKLAGRALPPPNVPLPPAASASAPPPTTALMPADTTVAQAPVPALKSSGSVLSKYWELDRADKRGVFNFTGYQPNYLLPVHVTSDINRSPQSPTRAAVLLPDYRNVEAKAQISLRTKAAQSLLLPDADLWLAYTQQSLWQVWNATDSKPFRNTDYEAEMIYMVPVPERYRDLALGWRWMYGQFAIAHQSNGQAVPLSRSWNRIYAGFGLERGDWSLTGRVNKRFKEDIEDDDNPDLTVYRGRGDLTLNWVGGPHTVSLLWRTNFKNLDRGAVQLDYTHPVYRNQPNGVRWFVQVFSGYGETLTDYNFRQTSLGLGLSFIDF